MDHLFTVELLNRYKSYDGRGEESSVDIVGRKRTGGGGDKGKLRGGMKMGRRLKCGNFFRYLAIHMKVSPAGKKKQGRGISTGFGDEDLFQKQLSRVAEIRNAFLFSLQ